MESVCGETINKNVKICADCKTSKTPLWRSGPAGPKSLCNACGIRYRKKRSVVGSDKKKEKHPPSPSSSSSSTTAAYTISTGNREIGDGEDDCGIVMKNGKNEDLRKKLRIKLVALGKEVVLLQRQRSPMKKVKRPKIYNQMNDQYKKLGEVEQAAFLLMSLSCGSVFA